jgi:hypothetical protein
VAVEIEIRVALTFKKGLGILAQTNVVILILMIRNHPVKYGM